MPWKMQFAWLLAAPLFLAPLFLASPAAAATTLADIDRAFVCPETLPDQPARNAAIGKFMQDMTQAAPKDTIPEAMAYRNALLAKHNCADTLRSLAAHDAAVRAGAVLDQAWVPLGQSPRGKLWLSTSYIRPFADPRFPTDRALETYVKVDFAEPAVTDVSHTTYDQIVSHNIYYCGSARFALVENDYFLKGAEVFKDRSPIAATVAATPVYAVQPITPGSLNAPAEKAACGAISGQAT
jgi:hypothetical protein